MVLTSPGVEVNVIDESFYTPAEPGTVPMIFVTTAQDKSNSSGTGTATGTLATNIGRPFLLTSQRELADTFGDPVFQIDSNNNPIHGSELNEYGLQAAYSILGISNRAYVTRAGIDLNQLQPSATEPGGEPTSGTYWFDTQVSTFGVFEWNGNAAGTTGGQSFTSQTVNVITDVTNLVGNTSTGIPKTSFGAIGDYAIVTANTANQLYYKNSSGEWVEVGSANWKKSWPTVVGSNSDTDNISTLIGTSIVINTVSITASDNTFTSLAEQINFASIPGVTAAVVNNKLELYSTGVDVVIGAGTANSEVGLTAGTYAAPALQISRHTQVPEFKTNDTTPRPTGSVWIKTTEPNQGARWRVKVYNGDTSLWENVNTPLYANNETAIYELDRAGGGVNLAVGDLYARYNYDADSPILANFKLFRRNATGPTSIRSNVVTTTITPQTYIFTIEETTAASSSFSSPVTISVTTTGTTDDADTIAGAINSAGLTNITASVDSSNRVIINHKIGGDIRFTVSDASPESIFDELGFSPFVDENSGTPNLYQAPGADSTGVLVASNWKELSYTASDDAPTSLVEDGKLWYSSVVDEVDIMIHNGTNWVGYLDATSPFYNASESEKTDPAGPIVSASEPTTQSDGTALKNGDLWIDTSDIDNYPTIYKYNGSLLTWELVDKSDQTTEDGIIFADARYGVNGGTTNVAPSGTIAEMLVSNYVDFDAPDPALYPKGMMLWNLRRSGFNVKRFERNYVDLNADNDAYNGESMSGYYPHRWVTESGNQEDGSGTFGRKAQRKVVVQSLQALLNSNDEIRDNESRIFNLMACPGYPELIGEMITLNFDRGLSAFIVADSPARLTPDATSLNEWGTNVNLVVEDNDLGLVSRDEYLGVYYPWGFTSDNFGNNIVVPPSHMMLRTITLSDQVSYPWFAPAGTRRGGITNASSVGYINDEGEFVSIALNEGQRDTLYNVSVNPITFITGAGLVAFGQKTRARNASSLDRINVARLVVYLRSQLNKLAKPYIFEPNDKITRDEIKQAAESLLLELVGLRAIYDFLVVCDESNNTPTRIDRNELYLDIAIEPVKAVEFIYIPLRLKNTGEIAGL